MRPALRLLWKQYRFELVAVTLASLFLIGVVVATTWRMDEVRPSTECLTVSMADLEEDELGACADAIEAWDARRQQYDLFSLVGAWPLLAAVVLGSVLVGREVEHRTAQLGWSLSGSRLRWLAWRIVPTGILLILLISALAVASQAMEGARYPMIDPRGSLDEYGNRGLPMVARAFGLFGLAVLVGAVAGRQLPALLVSGVLALTLSWGLAWVFPYGVSPEWVTADASTYSNEAQVRHRSQRGGYRTADESIISWQEADRLADEQVGVEVPNPLGDRVVSLEESEWIERNLDAVELVLMGDKLGEIELRESAMLGLLGLASLGGAAFVVHRRRPY